MAQHSRNHWRSCIWGCLTHSTHKTCLTGRLITSQFCSLTSHFTSPQGTNWSVLPCWWEWARIDSPHKPACRRDSFTRLLWCTLHTMCCLHDRPAQPWLLVTTVCLGSLVFQFFLSTRDFEGEQPRRRLHLVYKLYSNAWLCALLREQLAWVFWGSASDWAFKQEWTD